MAVEHFAVSVTNNLPLPNASFLPQGYYRSKLFIAPFATNPLVAAAGPLLSLLERLCVSPLLPPITFIRPNIEHELYAFRSHLKEKAYPEEFDALAYYLLCATIDEILGKNYLRIYGNVAVFKAFTPSSLSYEPQQHFFTIVNYLKERPNQYLDLLELVYYCLITGFEGEQHARPDGRQVLDNLIEELYQLIQKHRVNKSYQLFQPQSEIFENNTNTKKITISILMTFLILIASFVISHMLLEYKAKNIQASQFGITNLDDYYG